MNIIIYPPKTPIFAYIFDYPIRYYGLIMGMVFVIGVFFAYHLFKKKYNVSTADLFFDYAPIVIICSIIGARLFYVFASWEFYSKNLLEIIMINHGGLSIFGSIISGFFAILLLSKIKKFDLKKHLDIIALTFPLCQAIGRLGNYFNQEAYGAPTDGFLKLFVEEKFRLDQYKNVEFYHPTFLYEGFFNFLIFIFLLYLFRCKNLKSGTIAALYLVLYSIVRFFVEGIRIDSVCNIGKFPIAQIFSLLIFVTATISLFYINKKRAN